MGIMRALCGPCLSNRSLAAAKRVDTAKDDDIEDLYLVVVGLEVGGDPTAAEAVRRVMRRQGGVPAARPAPCPIRSRR
jgi:hypothetical protein